MEFTKDELLILRSAVICKTIEIQAYVQGSGFEPHKSLMILEEKLNNAITNLLND